VNENILRFPQDRAFGHLSVGGGRFNWQREAKGEVSVPVGTDVHLFVSEWSLQDLSWLMTLPPDVITAMRLAPATLPCGQLSHITKLKGLRELQFERVVFEDEDDLAALQSLPALRHVDFHLSNITDVAISHVSKCATVDEIGLTYTAVTADGLARLSKLPIKKARLGALSVQAEGLAVIGNCTSLEELSLFSTKVNDACLPDLVRLKNLLSLDLNWTCVSDKGVRYLRWLPLLRKLELEGTKITDLALDTLRLLPELTFLNLMDTQITAGGMSALSTMKQLTTLWVTGSPLFYNTEAVVELQRRLPDCDVSVNAVVLDLDED